MPLPPSTATVEDLVVCAQMGDPEAYEAIVQRFQSMALTYAYSILGDYDLAQDARQEAFINAYLNLLSLREPAAFPGWLRQIVLHHAIRMRKGRLVLMVPLDTVDDPAAKGPDPAQVAERNEQRQRVLQAIGKLPADERQVTQLYYLEHYSLRDISRRTALAVETVKYKLHRARARLRQRLMERMKPDIQKLRQAGDRRVVLNASREAVEQFDRQLQTMLALTTPKGQEQAVELICAQSRLLRFAGQLEEAVSALEKGLALSPLSRHPPIRARLRAELGLTWVQMAAYAKAQKELLGAQAILRRHGLDSPLMAAILNGLGLCAWGEGDFGRARRLYQAVLKTGDGQRSAILDAEAFNNLALLDWKDGRLEQARQNYQFCLRRWKKTGYRWGLAVTLMNLGIIEENLGHYTPARRRYLEALAIAGELKFAQVQSAVNSNLGNLCLNLAEWDQALQHSRQALVIARQVGDRRGQAVALENLALAHLGLKLPEQARAALAEGRKLAQTIGDQERVFSLELVEVELLLTQGTIAGMTERLGALRRTLESQGYASERPRLLRLIVQLELLRGPGCPAQTAFDQALAECRRQQNRPEEKRVRQFKDAVGFSSRHRGSS